MFDKSYIKGNVLDTPGVSWGPTKPQILFRNKGALVVKVKGHTGWSGRGETTYYPTTYYLFSIEKEEDANMPGWTFVRLKRLAERTPGNGWRTVVAEFTERARRMDVGTVLADARVMAQGILQCCGDWVSGKRFAPEVLDDIVAHCDAIRRSVDKYETEVLAQEFNPNR